MATKQVHGTWRVWLPAAFLGLFAIVICLRLVQIQVIDHNAYAAQAEAELAGSTTSFAQRGAILDRNGNVLSSSVDTWDIYVNSHSWRDEEAAERASEAIAAVTGAEPAAMRAHVADSGLIDVIVARDVPFADGRALIDQRLPGLIALPNMERTHPERDLATGLIGVTGLDNAGLSGIEMEMNEALTGTPGRAIFERDTTGEPIPFGQYVATDAVPGKDVVLTLDRYLQELAEDTLEAAIEEHSAKGGSIIMMDPDTGEILALATLPTVHFSDLNLDDPEQVALLANAAVSDLYEPGSVMKVVTTAAAIDAGVVTPDTSYYDSGTVEIYGIPIQNWDYNVYGQQTMTGVLQHSINTGAVFMAQLLGEDRFTSYLEAFGFGEPTGIDFPGEAAGIHRKPSDSGWSPVDLATQSFGQGISVTPLQMMAAVAAAINGGKLLEPHLVKATIGADGKRQETPIDVRSRPISEQTSRTIRQMLIDVVYPGWFHPAQPELYTAGGKSGTANIPIPGGEYTETQVASFIGFAPANDPKVLILVKLDDNADLMTGTQAAGPIFSDLVDATLSYMSVPPDAAAVSETR